MRVALVASSYLPRRGGLERDVDELARGLARRGVDVELLVQGAAHGVPRVVERDGLVVRRCPVRGRPGRLSGEPAISERLRLAAGAFDLADVHTANPGLALAAARAGFATLVFSPHQPTASLLSRRGVRSARAVLDHAAKVVCRTRVQAEGLKAALPFAAGRIRVLPGGVDAAAIRAAPRVERVGRLVLAVGRLERRKNLERAIAAMASLDPDHRLVVVGDGPSRSKLHAHAADLRVDSRVRFAGAVADAELYRLLRCADVLVNLGEERTSGSQILEGLSAGAAVVASDIAVHRETASRSDPARVVFVSPEGSPLEVADAIVEADGLGRQLREPPEADPPSWDAVAGATLELYETLRGKVRIPLRSNGDALTMRG